MAWSNREGLKDRSSLVFLLLMACTSASSPPPPLHPSPVPSFPMASSSASGEPAFGQAPEEDFRRYPPAPGPERVFQAPVPVDFILPGGMRVLHLEHRGMPVVSLQLVIRRGASAGAPGVASLLGPMLFQGTPTRSLFELSDALEELGARYWVTVEEDAILVGATVLAPNAKRALLLLADAVRNASFPPGELERLKERKIQALAFERDLPRVQLQRAVAELLYPERHPYRASLLLEESSIRSVNREALLRFHRNHVQPDSVVLVMAGDLSRQKAEELAMQVFGKWRGKAARFSAPMAPSGPSKAPSVLLLDLPGAPQTSVALCAVGAPYTSPDHDTLVVLSTLLSRRLNANLRGRHAYTYGVSSQVAFRHGPGPFMAGGDVVREKTAEAIREILGEVALLRDELVGYDELHEVKVILSALSARFETAESSVMAMTPMAIYRLEDREFMTLRVRLQMVTRETVQKVARTYLAPERLHLALVGDGAQIEGKVRDLHLGTVEVRKIHSSRIPSDPIVLDEVP
ncbi:MAG: pitrilysin family protein [Myxococcales bacterium]|nr:insulinase family protein [Polyangiaceae bacterium]MDW8251224.1 pitrilysin family protein [Myxococcales bacterium]